MFCLNPALLRLVEVAQPCSGRITRRHGEALMRRKGAGTKTVEFNRALALPEPSATTTDAELNHVALTFGSNVPKFNTYKTTKRPTCIGDELEQHSIRMSRPGFRELPGCRFHGCCFFQGPSHCHACYTRILWHSTSKWCHPWPMPWDAVRSWWGKWTVARHSELPPAPCILTRRQWPRKGLPPEYEQCVVAEHYLLEGHRNVKPSGLKSRGHLKQYHCRQGMNPIPSQAKALLDGFAEKIHALPAHRCKDMM